MLILGLRANQHGMAVVMEPFESRLADGCVIRSTLVLPAAQEATPMPAVILAHGFLANHGFVREPWASDLVRLGVAVLLVDRRGHGSSDGHWGPSPTHHPEQADDIAAALAHLRSRGDIIDATRIALIGHSDGGTAVLDAASMDWDIAATVSLSAAAAPLHRINHIAPANLLLLYGQEDSFILGRSDAHLIANATRGYLADEGRIGAHHDGSARALVRIAGVGHVDILYDRESRRIALSWIAEALGVAAPTELTSDRRGWVIAGLAALLIVILTWNGISWRRDLGSAPRARSEIPWRATATLVIGVWFAGLWLAAASAPVLNAAAGIQEAGSAIAVLLPGWALLVIAMGARAMRSRSAAMIPSGSREYFGAVARGGVAGLAVQAGIEAIGGAVYATPLTGQRIALFVALLVVAIPSWIGLYAAIAPLRSRIPSPWPELGLALTTAAVADFWFMRMSVLPAYLLAATLPFAAAYRAGRHPGRSVGAGVFGAVIYARCASLVCAWY